MQSSPVPREPSAYEVLTRDGAEAVRRFREAREFSEVRRKGGINMPFTFQQYVLGTPKPRYEEHPLEFGSDLDCAAYIIQDPGRSRAHDKILSAIRLHTGMTTSEVVQRGRVVKKRIADLACKAGPGEPIYVPARTLVEMNR